jgi:hypothetical protein
MSLTERERCLSLLSIETYATSYSRSVVEDQEYRAAHLDKSLNTTTTKSYILAKVRVGHQDILEAGRAGRDVREAGSWVIDVWIYNINIRVLILYLYQ